MREYSAGASTNDDYAYGCDNCRKMDGRPVLVWRDLDPNGVVAESYRSHFSICLECFSKVYFKFVSPIEKVGEAIIVKRAIISEKMRNDIFYRDRYQCVECKSETDLQIDHIVPFSKGGETKWDNLRVLCKMCNLKKGSKCQEVE